MAGIQDFGQSHVFLHGQGRAQYHVHDYRAPLSIKTVVHGEAVWRTDEGVFPLKPGRFLIINDRHPYSIDVDSPDPVETFCVFFRDGFIADAAHATTTSDGPLLDDASPPPEHHFIEAVQRNDDVLAAADSLRNGARTESALLRLAEVIVQADLTLDRLARQVPASKTSTRRELLRRLLKARDFVESSLGSPFTLDQAASAAALSTFHLHRSFRRTFGETLHRYATRRRLERAAELLKRTTLPVDAICGLVGFESATSFAALFRRWYGVTPRQFRISN